MPGELNPLRPNLSPAGYPGGDGMRNQYDQRGGRGGNKGGQGDKGKEKEIEAVVVEPAEEEGHLDADSFKGGKARAMIDQLFSDALPWEQEQADDKLTRLELLRKLRDEQTSGAKGGRPGPTPPRKTGAIPPRPGSTGPLGSVKVPPVPQAPTGPDIPALSPSAGGRRVETNFDPTAGVNSALMAQQELMQLQAARDAAAGTGASAAAGGLIPSAGRGTGELQGLAKILRPGTARPPGGTGALPLAAGASYDGGMLMAPLRPDIEILPEPPRNAALDAARRATAPLKVRPPSVDELSVDLPDLPATMTPNARSRPAVPRPVRPTGRIDAADAASAARMALDAGRPLPATGPLKPATPAAVPPRQAPRADGGLPAHAVPRAPAARAAREPAPEPPVLPLDVLDPFAYGEVSAAPRSAEVSATPDGTTRNLVGLEAMVPAAPAQAAPAPSWLAEPVAEGEPEAPAVSVVPAQPQWPGTPPKVKAGSVSSACIYRVIDVGSNKPLAGARIELEPVHDDDMLPNLHGQVDGNGWYGTEGLPPGEYRVTVRAPGYIPTFKVRLLEPGVVDDLAIFIAKP